MNTETIKSTTLASLYKKGIFQSISRLRYSDENNYPFVTLITKNGDKTSHINLFFGQKTAQMVNDNFSKGDMITQFLKHSEVIQTLNKDKEVRFKLSTSDNSQYASKSELSEVFGSNEEEETFDLELFKSSFTSLEVVKSPF